MSEATLTLHPRDIAFNAAQAVWLEIWARKNLSPELYLLGHDLKRCEEFKNACDMESRRLPNVKRSDGIWVGGFELFKDGKTVSQLALEWDGMRLTASCEE